MRLRRSGLQALLLLGVLVGVPGDSQSEHHKVGMLEATVCTDAPGVQHVRAVVEKRGENRWANCIELQFLDASANKVSSYVVPHDVPDGRNRIINIGTAAYGASSGTTLDVTLPAGLVMPADGMVCYHGRKESNQFDCKDIVEHFSASMEAFWADDERATCSNCSTRITKPAPVAAAAARAPRPPTV